jgi:hypothetical protein
MDTGDPLLQHRRIPWEVYVNDCIGCLEIKTYCSGIGRDRAKFRFEKEIKPRLFFWGMNL